MTVHLRQAVRLRLLTHAGLPCQHRQPCMLQHTVNVSDPLLAKQTFYNPSPVAGHGQYRFVSEASEASALSHELELPWQNNLTPVCKPVLCRTNSRLDSAPQPVVRRTGPRHASHMLL